jgi:periplasmic divalent cation tolerance protein
MTEVLVVFVTVGGREEAERIAGTVVTEKLAACVNVVPAVRSCYVWEGKLTWSEEVLLVVKTTRGGYGDLETRIRELHSYDVPEIVALPVERGFEKYLEWVQQSVSS